MRRKQCEVTDPQQIDAVLAAAFIGRLATNGEDGYPYATPVNYVWYRRHIYFHCSPVGEKLDNLGRDPRVCFEVDIPLAYIDGGFAPKTDICKVDQLYHSVIIRGKARIIPDGPLKVAALNALIAALEKGREFEPVTERLPAYGKCAVVEIEPVSITAKSNLLQKNTAEERLAAARYLKARDRPGDPETVVAMGFEPGSV